MRPGQLFGVTQEGCLSGGSVELSEPVRSFNRPESTDSIEGNMATFAKNILLLLKRSLELFISYRSMEAVQTVDS